MKTIEVSPEELTVLKTLTEHSPQGSSMSIGEVRTSIKILDILDVSKDSVTFEDFDYNFLMQRFETCRFVRADRVVLSLFDKLAKV